MAAVLTTKLVTLQAVAAIFWLTRRRNIIGLRPSLSMGPALSRGDVAEAWQYVSRAAKIAYVSSVAVSITAVFVCYRENKNRHFRLAANGPTTAIAPSRRLEACRVCKLASQPKCLARRGGVDAGGVPLASNGVALAR